MPRYSVHESDAGYCNYIASKVAHKNLAIFVDGKLVDTVHTVDEERGFIIRWKRAVNEEFITDDEGHLVDEVIKGDVKVKLVESS